MADGSLSAWNTVKTGFSDTRRGFDVYPMMYLGLIAIFGIQQFLIGPISRKNDADVTFSDALLALGGLALSILVVPIAISLVRYFVSGDYSRPYSFSCPFLRIVGWTILLAIMTAVFVAAAFGFIVLAERTMAMPIDATPQLIAFVFLGVCYAVLMWFFLRLSTLYPALALDESSPIFARSFGETRGYVWYIIRVILWSLFVFIPIAVAIGAVEYILLGGEALELPPGAPDVSLPVRLADAAIVGVLSSIMTAVWIAIAARIFVVVRGAP